MDQPWGLSLRLSPTEQKPLEVQMTSVGVQLASARGHVMSVGVRLTSCRSNEYQLRPAAGTWGGSTSVRTT